MVVMDERGVDFRAAPAADRRKNAVISIKAWVETPQNAKCGHGAMFIKLNMLFNS